MSKKDLSAKRSSISVTAVSQGMTFEEIRATLSHLERMIQQGALSKDDVRLHKEALVRSLTKPDQPLAPPTHRPNSSSYVYEDDELENSSSGPLSRRLLASLETRTTPQLDTQGQLVLPQELVAYTRAPTEYSERDTQGNIEYAKNRPSQLPELHPGTILNRRYRLEEYLGGGSTGQVFRAFDLRTTEKRAVKVIHPRLAQQKGFLSTLQELQENAQRLTHRSLVRLFALERDLKTGHIYQVTELIEGLSVSTLLERARVLDLTPPLPLATTHIFLRKLLAALSYLHKHDIIHRNLKPSNIMLVKGPSGMELKLLDVGLPGTLQKSAHPIQHKHEVSKLFYMAPEQLAGNGPYQPATDLYSVGILLYLMMTGVFPSALAPHPSELVPSYPRGLDRVLQRAVRLNPRQRHQSCADFFGEFTRTLDLSTPNNRLELPTILLSEPVPDTQPQAAPEWLKDLRNEEKTRLDTLPYLPPFPLTAAPLPAALAPMTLGDAESSCRPLATLPINNPEASPPQCGLNHSGTFLAASANPGSIQLWETEAWHPLYNISSPNPLSTITTLAWSQKADLLAFASTNGDVWVWNCLNDRCLAHLPHSSPVSCLLWLPQDRALCVGCTNGQIHFWSLFENNYLGYNMSHQHTVTAMQCHPEDRFIASVDSGGYAHLIELDSGQTHLALPPNEGGLYALAFSQSNGHLLVGGHGGMVQQWDIEHGTPIHFCMGHHGTVNAVEVCHSHPWFASGADDGTVGIWSLRSGKRLATFEGPSGHQAPIHSLCIDREGQWLASASVDGTLKIWPTSVYGSLA